MQDYIIQSIQEGIRLKENILNNRQMLADIETVGNLRSEEHTSELQSLV
mgnify:CR=1 FL=1